MLILYTMKFFKDFVEIMLKITVTESSAHRLLQSHDDRHRRDRVATRSEPPPACGLDDDVLSAPATGRDESDSGYSQRE